VRREFTPSPIDMEEEGFAPTLDWVRGAVAGLGKQLIDEGMPPDKAYELIGEQAKDLAKETARSRG
jgi:hypothetical protein